MRLKDKVALITGAAGPMGQAIAQRFIEEGAKVIITDISSRRLAEIEDKLGHVNGKILIAKSNVLNFDDIQSVVEKAFDEMKKIDILVNLVGGILDPEIKRTILEMDEERWDNTLALNLKSCMNCIQLVAPKMLEQKYGKIINVSSIHMAGEKEYSDYAAAKAGVAALTKTAAMEFSPYINVNCLAPGLIQTRVLERMDSDELSYHRKRSLLGKLGEPIDVANGALFLASDEARHITGQILAISGGIWPHL